MRTAAIAVVVLVALAGCVAPLGLGDGSTATPRATSATPTDSVPDRTVRQRWFHADPPADRLGWEAGYWHDEPVNVTNADGLNESERAAVVARAMARVELVRRLEFNESVPVTVINRSTFAAQSAGDHSDALRQFDNVKFEALFLVGESTGSLGEQEQNRNASVAGYYSPSRDAIVIVSDRETPTLSGESTLAHELVHALQDQQFDIANGSAETRSGVQGRKGLIEGDARYTERIYMNQCGDDWRCVQPPDSEGGAEGGESSIHQGIFYLKFYPYSDGPGFVERLRDRGGWAAVNDAYADPPEGVPEVTDPDRYPDWRPRNVTLRDRSSADWQRVRPPGRPDYAVVGQSGIAAGLTYTLYDEFNRSAVLDPRDALNLHPNGSVKQSDPFEYDLAPAKGWAGGRMHVFRSGEESAYVWRTRWDDAGEAREFADAWATVVAHWGGHRAGDAWVIPDGPYADAVRIDRSGATVTIVNAPSRAELEAVHGG